LTALQRAYVVDETLDAGADGKVGLTCGTRASRCDEALSHGMEGPQSVVARYCRLVEKLPIRPARRREREAEPGDRIVRVVHQHGAAALSDDLPAVT